MSHRARALVAVASLLASCLLATGFAAAQSPPDPGKESTGADESQSEDVEPAAVPEVRKALTLPPNPYEILGRSLLVTPPLDVAQFSPPASHPQMLGRVLNLAREEPDAALARLRNPDDPASRVAGAELAAAALEARLAIDRADLVAARQRLRSALNDGKANALRPTATLELARADLVLGLHPEAVADGRRAEREFRGKADSLADAAQLVQAEALYLARRGDRALELYERMSHSKSKRIVAAAALRKTDIAFDRDGTAPGYDEKLAEIGDLGIDPRPWAPRAAESSIHAGDAESAQRWLLRFLEEGATSPVQAAAAIRLADIEAAQGERQKARDRLEEIETNQAGTPVAALAKIRLVAHGLLDDTEAGLDRLRAAAGSLHPAVSAYANALLGRELLAHGQVDESIDALVRASRSRANPVADETPADLTLALRAAASDAADGDCSRLLLRLAIRRAHLMEIVSDPDPFLRLGFCFEQIGLHTTAMEIYRSLARSLGPAAAEPIALPLARSSLAVGEIAAAHTRALANSPNPNASPEWQWILARSSLASGKSRPALKVLLRLAQLPSAEASQPEVLALLARVALETDASSTAPQLLEAKLTALPAAERHDEADAVGEAALLTATMQRRSGRAARARALYAMAADVLPEGWRRTEASYWLERLGGHAEGVSETFEQAASDPATAQLARLGVNARAVARLRGRLQVNGKLAGPR